MAALASIAPNFYHEYESNHSQNSRCNSCDNSSLATNQS